MLNPILFADSKMDNDVLLYSIAKDPKFEVAEKAVFEAMLASYSPIGYEQGRTIILTGRLVQVWFMKKKHLPIPIIRSSVAHYHCPHSPKNKITDAMVKTALQIRYGEEVGRKKPVGPLKGLDSHSMQAFATGVAVDDGVRSTITIRGKKFGCSFGELEEIELATDLRYFG
jgi:hypothetical protein